MLSSSLLPFKPILPCYKLGRLRFMSVFTHVSFQIQLECKMEVGCFINIVETIM